MSRLINQSRRCMYNSPGYTGSVKYNQTNYVLVKVKFNKGGQYGFHQARNVLFSKLSLFFLNFFLATL